MVLFFVWNAIWNANVICLVLWDVMMGGQYR